MVCISWVLAIARFTCTCSPVANRNDTLRKTKISLNCNNMTTQVEKFVRHNSCMQCMFSVIVLEPWVGHLNGIMEHIETLRYNILNGTVVFVTFYGCQNHRIQGRLSICTLYVGDALNLFWNKVVQEVQSKSRRWVGVIHNAVKAFLACLDSKLGISNYCC